MEIIDLTLLEKKGLEYTYSSMSNQKILYNRLSALIRVRGKYLLVRSLKDDGSNKSGFHLPGTLLNESKPERALARYFAKYFDAEIEVKGGLEPIEKSPDALYAYLCVEKKPILFPETNVEFGFYGPKDLDYMNVEPADRVAIKKAELYLPLLLKRKRVTKFTPGEVDKVDAMLRSLSYFEPRLPKSEAKQFEELVNSEIKYADLVKAYRFLLSEFDLNYYEFFDRPSKNRKHSSDI